MPMMEEKAMESLLNVQIAENRSLETLQTVEVYQANRSSYPLFITQTVRDSCE